MTAWDQKIETLPMTTDDPDLERQRILDVQDDDDWELVRLDPTETVPGRKRRWRAIFMRPANPGAVEVH